MSPEAGRRGQRSDGESVMEVAAAAPWTEVFEASDRKQPSLGSSTLTLAPLVADSTAVRRSQPILIAPNRYERRRAACSRGTLVCGRAYELRVGLESVTRPRAISHLMCKEVSVNRLHACETTRPRFHFPVWFPVPRSQRQQPPPFFFLLLLFDPQFGSVRFSSVRHGFDIGPTSRRSSRSLVSLGTNKQVVTGRFTQVQKYLDNDTVDLNRNTIKMQRISVDIRDFISNSLRWRQSDSINQYL